ncbi:PREDICTED: sodium channel and clathrin linker 1-like isoform X2 [Amphimedon queenslandica]|uniref:Sodium channel and clathrin linker 1 n=1 Tax=Amphimedon queenslandica TaxID=400682 RepID=A0A1X7VBD2_AMPQE|nr:PREDICTED: sodium channel and clathrin linker 1-like isoform X2 [Amphimedon queenslandica]|eukprot:XP_019849912.1 PREDICTED: sodium channel and clathrin linker 1-like isoform X2 [Amphimedon queenslandica]
MATQDVDQLNKPLIQEYERIINDLKQQIQQYKADSVSLKQDVQTVTDENERLHEDLLRAYQHIGSPSIDLLKDKQDGTRLLKQSSIELKVAEKADQEASVSQYKSSLAMYKKELSTTQQSLTELQESYDKLQLEYQRSVRTAKNFYSELTTLREEQSLCKDQLNQANQKNSELVSLLDSTRDQLKRKITEMNAICIKESSSDQRVSVLQAANGELESRLAVIENECSKLSDYKALLEAKLSSLQETINAFESREHVAVDHVKESMQLLEAALAEKDQSDIKEQHYVSEIRHLEKKVSILLEEVGARTKLEVDKVRAECNKNIDIMASEIEHLEKQCAKKQSHIEKLQRDKEELNEELKKVTMQCPEEQLWVKETLKEIRSKLLQSERSKHEAISELNATKRINSNLQKSLLDEQRKSAYFEEGLKEQRQLNCSDSQQFRQEINLLTETNKALQEQISQMSDCMQLSVKESEQKVNLAHEELQIKEKELSMRLKYAEENQQRMTSEFKQQMLMHQQSTNKWQKEISDLHSKFEKALLDMNTKLMDSKAKNKELNSKLHRLLSSSKSVNLTLVEHEKTISSLNDKLYEAESSAEQRRRQISLLVTREKKALKEKEELSRQLHKAKFQMAQSLNVANVSFLGTDAQLYGDKVAEFYSQSHDDLSISSAKTIDA